jgi:hypothetical protein
MNQKQIDHVLEGLQERINRISDSYKREVEWNHRDGEYQHKGIRARDIKKQI